MARAGVLRTRRDGTRIFYMLASDRVAELWAALRDVAAEHVAGTRAAGRRRTSATATGSSRSTRDELAARLTRGEVVVLDVRPAAEFAAGHIAGARSVPLAELRRQLRALPQGRRSRRLLPRPVLRVRRRRRPASCAAAGYRARRLEDGFPEWKRAGLPVAVGEGG